MRYTADNRNGFTLVEIMVVLALTILILGLVFGPVIRTFGFTRSAEIMVRAQDNARFALEQVSRDLADAMFVYDNTNQPINFPMPNAAGNVVDVPVLYAKVDIVLPRIRGYCTAPASIHPDSEPRDFARHDPGHPELDEATPICPICGTPLELRPAQPLAADNYVVRYFIGLRDPNKPYSNGYTNRFASGDDNMFVLYRVEFSPYDDNLFGASNDAAANLSDPNFFYGPYSAAWREISRPMVTLDHTDLIVQEMDGGAPKYDGNGRPIVTPTVKFTPTAIYNDPLVPTIETGDDPEHGDLLPTVYKASYGQWTTPIEVTLFRKLPNGGTVTFKAGKQPGQPCILRDPGGNQILDITDYVYTKTDPRASYPGRPYGVGRFPSAPPEVAFTIDETKGAVNFSFPVVDLDASSSMGRMAVSMIASTDDINSRYATYTDYKDRYRSLWVNDPDAGLAPIANATVVPGSERVVAPDASPGSNYGRATRYQRVPSYLYEPGLNQYQLDVNYQAVDSSGAPIVKPGLACLFFHSYQTHQTGSGLELPGGTNNVFVYYEVQNNKKDDSLRANYVTKSLMTVMMGVRIYDPITGRPQVVQLTNKVALRNIAE